MWQASLGGVPLGAVRAGSRIADLALEVFVDGAIVEVYFNGEVLTKVRTIPASPVAAAADTEMRSAYARTFQRRRARPRASPQTAWTPLFTWMPGAWIRRWLGLQSGRSAGLGVESAAVRM